MKTETAFSSLKWQQLNTESLKAGDFIHTEGEYFVLSAALGAGSPVTDTWTADFLSREGESREYQLVTATHRAWGARQGANGTEGEDATGRQSGNYSE